MAKRLVRVGLFYILLVAASFIFLVIQEKAGEIPCFPRERGKPA